MVLVDMALQVILGAVFQAIWAPPLRFQGFGHPYRLGLPELKAELRLGFGVWKTYGLRVVIWGLKSVRLEALGCMLGKL